MRHDVRRDCQCGLSRVGALFFGALCAVCFFALLSVSGLSKAWAAEGAGVATVYTFAGDSHYEFSSEEEGAYELAGDQIGSLRLSGEFSELDDDASVSGGVPGYLVSDGNIQLFYDLDDEARNAGEGEWQLVDDDSRQVDDEKLDENIQRGAVIVQSSFDGVEWYTDSVIVNALTDDTYANDPFYTTKDIQLENGCFYRVIVVYKMEMKTGTHKVLMIDVEDTETKKAAEVYEFYAVSESALTSEVASAADAPRRELGHKVKTGTDNGYSDEREISNTDPHYGWDLGTFVVNGYTRETTDDNGSPVFLKNVGDQVVLWFTLKQDIECLNGNEDFSISEDVNGYDQGFEVGKTNFGRGTLIIRYTDHEGVRHDPVIYTDYLAANARTGADTRVQLFEEGDYEVALDYEISSPGALPMTPTYSNYRISFSFSIRNGNCMVFPMDVSTLSELSDGDITPNGFQLDMARSRYLTIDVTRSVLKENESGGFTQDVRYSRPAKDGESYTEPGIYTFEVSNLYTDEHATKTIYVGDDEYLSLLSQNGWSVEELNDWLTTEDEEGPKTEDPAADAGGNDIQGGVGITSGESPASEMGLGAIPEDSTDTGMAENNASEGDREEGLPMPLVVIGVVVVVCAALVIGALVIRKRGKSDDEVSGDLEGGPADDEGNGSTVPGNEASQDASDSKMEARR